MNDGFLSGLLNSIGSGARSTMDAAEQDMGRIGEGRLPDHAIQLLSQLLGAYQPTTGLLPRIGANTLKRKVFDSKTGWGTAAMEHPSVDPLISLLMNASPGSMRDMMLKMIRQNQQNQGMK